MNRVQTHFLTICLLGLFLSGWCVITAQNTLPMEQAYNELLLSFESRDANLQNDLKDYLIQYPYTTYEDEVYFMSGVLDAEKGKWKQAAKDFDKVDFKALDRRHQPMFQFYKGYVHLMLQQYERATTYFALLRRTANPYTEKATYYFAYCQYKLKKYDRALPALLSLEEVEEYQTTVPYFIVQAYYAQNNYAEVETRAKALLAKDASNPNAGELHRMLGEIYYQQKDFHQSIRHLKAYEAATKNPELPLVRNDIYLLGMAAYQVKDWNNAIQYLKKVEQAKDTISESACLTIGHAYRALSQLEQAKLAYQAAVGYGLTAKVTEEAAYNYTLCTYEQSTALGESVKAFTDFLKNYPKSTYKEQIFTLLSDAFMHSKNYQAALRVLDSIPQSDLGKEGSKRIAKTRMYLRYQLGVDAFLQGKMGVSRDWMTEVINETSTEDLIRQEAYFWRAEANYRLHDYEATVRDINTYLAQPKVRQSVNYLASPYLYGYALFSLKQYDAASQQFIRYIDQIKSEDPTYADALNRLGDCAFNARSFQTAIGYYGQVIERNATGADYATFQKGFSLGLLHKYQPKILSMRELVSRYPKSDYADDAMYEIARAQLQLEDEAAAIATYEDLLSRYPHSNYGRKASLERAMLYRNLQRLDESIAAYKATIDRYPATEEAYEALDALQALYVETNNISAYLDYTKELSKKNMQVTTADDSLSYAAAELQYIQGNYAVAATALSHYLSNYCTGGRYCTTAQYQLADSYYRLNQSADALVAYKTLADIAGNPYIEEACMRVAGISYDSKDYTTSLDYFYRLLSASSSVEHTDIARLGILRCSYLLGQHTTTIDIANQILDEYATSKDKDELLAEAYYNRAKAYHALKQWPQAQSDWQLLAKEVRTANGAEAKYRVAECLFLQSELDNAEAEIMSFAQMKTQQQYWLARAIILLADINVERDDLFQAKQYLLSLQSNYQPSGAEDDILTRVSERLSTMGGEESPTSTDTDTDEDDVVEE